MGCPSRNAPSYRAWPQSYADAAIHQEWPQMAREEVPNESREINRKMWKTLMSIKSATPTELIAQDHALYELSALTQYRRTRILQSTERLARRALGSAGRGRYPERGFVVSVRFGK